MVISYLFVSSQFQIKIYLSYIRKLLLSFDIMLKICLVFLILSLVVSDKILVVLDNKDLSSTHSNFFSILRSNNKNEVQISYSFGKDNIELKYYDRFRYDHIVIMCTSDKQIESSIKTRDIINYFDEGGNVIVIGDVDTSFSFRKLFYSFGVELDQSGTQLKDHFNNHQSSTLISTSNYQKLSPFFSEHASKQPLLYKGIGLSLVNYQNYQLYNLIKAQPTTFTKNYNTGQAVKAGTSISLAAGVQGLNNARALIFGSLHFFSNQVIQTKGYGNKEVIEDLVKWVFRKKGIIKVKSMSYHGEGINHKETLFNVGQKLYFSAQIEQYNAEQDFWKPYIANDIQVELVMLDPWVRSSLVKGPGNSYNAAFYAPLKEGIYQFKIIYKRPGFNFVKEAERVTIRPYKHDEFERFIFVAYPYIFGTFGTIIGTFIFVVIYIYQSAGKVKQE